MLSFLTQAAAASAPTPGSVNAPGSMFDDDFFNPRTRSSFPVAAAAALGHHHGHHGLMSSAAVAAQHFPFGGFPVHHDPFNSKTDHLYTL